jgi:hypothetical protein
MSGARTSFRLAMTDSLSPAAQLVLLEKARLCCKSCGTRWGVYSVGCSSSWIGTCHVCGEYKFITDTRDYGYLIAGRRELAALVDNGADND